MFADRAKILIRSGKGGDGHISFRREKYVPDGGPDGGDGGDGGSVYFVIDEGMNTLADYRHVRKYKAGDGEDGGKRNCRGKNGNDIYLKVPKGTVIKEANSGKIIVDMSGDNDNFRILKGGRGGNGNQHYATSTMQAPKYAQPGQPARELELYMELKVIADVGLIGFPNVGKSTLLSGCSNAKPEIANYHFTTLSPHLGVVDVPGGTSFVMADIPGIIEGASEGVGLGFDFLRHIERTKVFIHVVDASGSEGRNPLEDIETIHNELTKYNPDLLKRPVVIAANKIDIISDEPEDMDDNGNFIYADNYFYVQKIKEKYEPLGFKVFPISSYTKAGVKELLYYVSEVLNSLDKAPVVFEQEFDPETHYPVSDEPYSVSYDYSENEYVVEGPRIEKMLGYTNLDSEKGFAFFQNFLKDNGILDELEALGIKEGDTVRIYGFSFEYFK
ncbi:MAG: GTPase ObgE [Lachnospiraceae bacterium]|nr:GTPase ObgE [Lachnospiraceae bacterium]